MIKDERLIFFLIIVFCLFLISVGCRSQAPVGPTYYSRPTPNSDHQALLSKSLPPHSDWSAEEVELLKSLWLGSLPPVPPSPSNAMADDPQAAALGHRLFFDPRLSANQQIACATCHAPALAFTDGQVTAHGTHPNVRNTITLMGAAYSPWQLWDGRHETLWSQALEPIENPMEQGSTRLHAVRLIHKDDTYRQLYETLFGPLPEGLDDFTRFPDAGGPVEFEPYRTAWDGMTAEDQAAATQIYVNLGKSIAAYERLLVPTPTRFDSYVQALLANDTEALANTLTAEEIAGLRLFIGSADCVRCHSGPLFTDHTFRNTGAPRAENLPLDKGRLMGIQRLLDNEFNCRSAYNDDEAASCDTLDGLSADAATHRYAFKVPTLRNVTETAPYMHSGQLLTLEAVLAHYNQAPLAPSGDSELAPLNLSDDDIDHLITFLQSLSAPLSIPEELLSPPSN